jgi:HlyD family secretion protein
MNNTAKTANTQTEELSALLRSEGRSARPARSIRRIGACVLAVLLLLGGGAALRSRASAVTPTYQTEAVTRATLHVTVTATGNLQPTNKVDIGSELSGTIETVLVDENDTVRKGQVLARLDVSKLKDQITKSEAALASAEAKRAQADATEKEAAANVSRLREVSQLSGGKVPSRAEMETAEATLVRAQAEQSSARAAVNEARAVLSSDRINLSKASIRSPIDGVVLSRSVEPGQTVAASLQVATLFTIAEDLREMELEVAVDEADVGKVKDGQQATFTVDAHPNRKYTAQVTRVAFGSTTSNSVVSYTTTLKVKNDDLSLRPGMTATAEIATITRDNVLLVPNAALRFTPAASTGEQGRGLMGSLMPGPPRDSSRQSQAASKTDAQQVWIVHDGQPVAIALTVGETNGRYTEVTSGDLREAVQVVTDSSGTGQ